MAFIPCLTLAALREEGGREGGEGLPTTAAAGMDGGEEQRSPVALRLSNRCTTGSNNK